MNHFSFTKSESRIAKGVAILLMLYHHLFANNRLPKTYTSLLSKSPINLVSILSDFGNICVSIFVILTGIGLFYISQKKDYKKWCLHHVLSFIVHYWFVFILFVPIGFLFFNRPFFWKELLKNFFFLSYSYNLEWWFLRVYLEILLVSPWMICSIKKAPKLSFIASLFLSFVGYLLHESNLYQELFFKEFSTLFLWQLMFFIGYYIAYYQVFEHISYVINRFGLNTWWFSFTVLIFCIFIRQGTYITSKLKDPLLAPIFLLFSVCLIKQLRLNSLFSYLGKHSFNIWLIHTFFCYYYTAPLILLPRVSILIFIWLVVLSLGTSYMINKLELQLLKGLKKWNKNITSPYVIY